MKTKIIQIGNSKGIRIPKVVLEQCGLQDEVELTIRKNEIVIAPSKKARQGWRRAFKRMAQSGDDHLLDKHAAHSESSWDIDEWEW